MSAAAVQWAERYSATLLGRLEREERDGWPDLPWPPVEPSVRVHAEQIDVLRRVTAAIYGLLVSDEEQRLEELAAESRRLWATTAPPRLSPQTTIGRQVA